MRCDVINIIELKTVSSDKENTDIEIWREASSYSKALVTSSSRDITKYIMKNGNFVRISKPGEGPNQEGERCQKAETPEAAKIKGNHVEKSQESLEKNYLFKGSSSSSNDGPVFQQNASSNNVCQNDLVDSALPPSDNRQRRLIEIQKLKANCQPEELQKIKTKCERLVRDCIASLLIQLSVKDFRDVEGMDLVFNLFI